MTNMMELMEFPDTFDEFVKEYGFKDDKEVYTNGSDLIPIFRVKQWLEHDNKLRAIETDTAYECGKAVLNKIRTEIAEYGSICVAYAITDKTKTDKGVEKLVSDVLKQAKEQVLDIIDKYR